MRLVDEGWVRVTLVITDQGFRAAASSGGVVDHGDGGGVDDALTLTLSSQLCGLGSTNTSVCVG